MQQGTLPEYLEEDLTSGYCPANASDMVKPPSKHPYPFELKSPSSLKSKDKAKDESKDKVKRWKRTHKCTWVEGSHATNVNDDEDAIRDNTEQAYNDMYLVHEGSSVPPPPPVSTTK